MVDDEGFPRRHGDAEVSAAGGMRIFVELLKLFIAGESCIGHKTGLGLVGGNLELRIVDGRVWVARVARVSLGKQRSDAEQGNGERCADKHGSFYPAVNLATVALTGRRGGVARSGFLISYLRFLPG